MTARAVNPAIGPVVILTPNVSCTDLWRKVDSVCTFSIPSAPQKRACAKGRSAEIQSTTVFSNVAAR